MISLQDSWYRKFSLLTLVLLPISAFYCLLVSLRRGLYRLGLRKIHPFPVPVIVVGNITVGGTGKTPLVTALVAHLKGRGYRPGVVSRGYGGNASSWPQTVSVDSNADIVGDEAVLIARSCACPMVVGPDRPAAVRQLLAASDCNIVISDDGLQHYALSRDIEIVVIDAQRQFGNGLCLPAGPLRERRSRIKEVDLVVYNGGQGSNAMHLHAEQAVNLEDEAIRKSLEEFVGQAVHAVAGIGNPQRFFQQLKDIGLQPIEHPFPDHYAYRQNDLDFADNLPILMTEKDAVKCRALCNRKLWWVPVTVELSAGVWQTLNNTLEKIHGQKTA